MLCGELRFRGDSDSDHHFCCLALPLCLAQRIRTHIIREAEMDEDEGEIRKSKADPIQMVTLRNGAEMDSRAVLADLDTLRHLQDQDPDLFAALVALVKPRLAKHLPDPEVVTANALEELRAGFILREDGTVLPAIAKVLDASYYEVSSQEGVVLRDPIVHPNPAQAAALEKQQRENLRRFRKRLFDDELDDPEDGISGRPR
jgi:hypothetical protein